MKQKIILFFLLVFGIISKAQVANAPCNEYSPWITSTYPSMTVANQTNLFGGDTWSNKNNLISNTGSAASWTTVALGSSWIEARNASTSQFPAGSYAGFVIADFNLTSLAGSISVSTYLNGTLQDSRSFNSFVGIDLVAGKRKLGLITTKPFNRIRLTVNAGITTIFNIQAFYAETMKPCAGAALACNTSTALVRPAFAATIVPERSGLSGVNVGSLDNLEAVTNADLSDYATVNLLASVLGSAKISVRDLGDTFPIGTFAGFDVENANFVSASVLGNITISTYKKGVFRESKTGTTLLASVPLFDYSNRQTLGFVANLDFDEIQITFNKSIASVNLGTTKVYSAVVKKACEAPALTCNTMTGVVEPLYPVSINAARTGVAGIASVSSTVANANNVIDANSANYASINLPVVAGTGASLSVVKSLAPFAAGTYAGFDVENNSLLNVDAFKSITITTYLNGVQKESVTGNGLLASVGSDFVASTGRYNIGFVTTQDFNEVQIIVTNLAGVNFGTTKIYKLLVMKPCQKTINCNSSYYWTRPDFPVVLNAQRTGIFGLATVGGSINNPDNVLDNVSTNYSRITMGVGVGSYASISAVDPTATYPQGTFAGVTVKDNYALVQTDLLEFTTIKTYLDGVLQESKTSTDLIDLTALIPIWGTGTRNIGFYTTKPFDEIEVSVASLASVANVVDVYGFLIDTRQSNGGSLNCAQSIVANNDTMNVFAGSTSTAVVTANDTYQGNPATAGTNGNVTITQTSTTNSGVNINPANGTVTVAPGTSPGIYTIVYHICNKITPQSCSNDANVVVTVANRPINAVADNFVGYTVGTAATTPSVLANDTLDGQPATVGTNGNVTLTAGTLPAGFTMNTDGTVNVPANAAAGTYNIPYTIAEVANPGNTSSVTSTVKVDAPAITINAVDDAMTIAAGSTGTTSVLANDTLNGLPATLATTPITVISTSNAGVTLDTATGLISVASNVTPGIYQVNYRVTDAANSANSDEAVATITVTGNVDLAASISVDRPYYVAYEATTAFVKIRNAGNTPSSGLITVTVNFVGEVASNFDFTLPSGWNYTQNGNIIVMTSTQVINPAQEVNLIIGYTTEGGLANNTPLSIQATIAPGSGGDNTTQNNTASVVIFKRVF